MRYLTAADARMRLHNSYCLYDGVPVIVHIPTDAMLAQVVDLAGNGVIATVDPNDERLDVESLPLGYVRSNNGGVCAYARRLPYRQQKQGVSGDNTFVKWERWGLDHHNSRGETFAAIGGQAALEMFQGKYPTFDEARHKIENIKSVESIAFHRKLCLISAVKRGSDKKNNLSVIRYAGKTMGFIFKDKREALITESFSDPVFRILLSKLGVEHEILPTNTDEDDSGGDVSHEKQTP